MKIWKLWYGLIVLYALAVAAITISKFVCTSPPIPVEEVQPIPVVPPPKPPPVVHLAPTTYHTYQQVVNQLFHWHKEAPDITEVDTYGDSVYYLHLTNHTNQPKVVLSATIHGNEVTAAMINLQWAGLILKDHQDLLKTREIYFIPVFSPRSYPQERMVYGVDPNRNFPDPYVRNNPVPHIQAFCKFMTEIKPKAFISGHTCGRTFLTPWGDTDFYNPNHQDYLRIVRGMMQTSGYKTMRICQNYGHPIYGTEADWCHRQGIFSIIMESGLRMGVPTDREIEEETALTFNAVLYYIEEAPKVVVRQPNMCVLPELPDPK